MMSAWFAVITLAYRKYVLKYCPLHTWDQMWEETELKTKTDTKKMKPDIEWGMGAGKDGWSP